MCYSHLGINAEKMKELVKFYKNKCKLSSTPCVATYTLDILKR